MAKSLPTSRGSLEQGNAVMLATVAAVSGRTCVECERKEVTLTPWFLAGQMEAQSDHGWDGGELQKDQWYILEGETQF